MIVLLVLPLLLAGQSSVDDLDGFPSGVEIARHYVLGGPSAFRTGRWRTTFKETLNLSGDVAVVAYDVTVAAAVPPTRLRPVYHYALTVQIGSMNCWAFISSNDSPEELERMQAELRRKQQDGECPAYVLRVWQVER